MLEYKGKQYRNLEEQVQKNKEDIAAHYNRDRVLADFGITVIGELDSPEELEGLTGGVYGAAYLINGSFYVWTRANPDAGHDTDYWLDIGPIAIVGPQGPQGETGPQGTQGKRGSLWWSGRGVPAYTVGYNIGDYYVNSVTGNYYHLHDVEGNPIWQLEGNLTGPQGPVGKQGETGPQGAQGEMGPAGPAGPAGPVFDVYGEITDVNELPDPQTADRQSAYIQTRSGTKYLWIIMGEPGQEQWVDVGVYASAGAQILVNGQAVSSWDADTKLDKKTASNNYTYVYGYNKNGQSNILVGEPINSSGPIVTRTSGGNILVPYDQTASNHAASKSYVDIKLATKATLPDVSQGIPATDVTGQETYLEYSENATPSGVVQRREDGHIALPSTRSSNADDAARVGDLPHLYRLTFKLTKGYDATDPYRFECVVTLYSNKNTVSFADFASIGYLSAVTPLTFQYQATNTVFEQVDYAYFKNNRLSIGVRNGTAIDSKNITLTAAQDSYINNFQAQRIF